jgi:Ser/Thr protein kinase RdoA (MazF antagonist)
VLDDLIKAEEALRSAESAMGREGDRYGLVHGDPSFGNIFFNANGPQLIDFDDFGFGHYAFDIATVLAGAWGKEGYEDNRSALLSGYREVRSLSREETDAIPALMAARAASLVIWSAGQSPERNWIKGQWIRVNEYMGWDHDPDAVKD